MTRFFLILVFVILLLISFLNLFLYKDNPIYLLNSLLTLALALLILKIFNLFHFFIKKMDALLNKLIEGEQNVGIKYENKGEFQKISEKMNRFLENLRGSLKENEKRAFLTNKIIRNLLRVSPQAIGILESQKLKINPKAQELFGVNWSEISVDFFLNHKENTEFRELYKEIFEDKIDEKERKIGIYFPSKQKKEFFNLKVITLKDEEGEVNLSLLFFKPLSE